MANIEQNKNYITERLDDIRNYIKQRDEFHNSLQNVTSKKTKFSYEEMICEAADIIVKDRI